MAGVVSTARGGGDLKAAAQHMSHSVNVQQHHYMVYDKMDKTQQATKFFRGLLTDDAEDDGYGDQELPEVTNLYTLS